MEKAGEATKQIRSRPFEAGTAVAFVKEDNDTFIQFTYGFPSRKALVVDDDNDLRIDAWLRKHRLDCLAYTNAVSVGRNDNREERRHAYLPSPVSKNWYQHSMVRSLSNP